jgi:hypothetical protein
MVFQWACGTWSINRCPRGQRPRSVPCWSRSRSRRETPVGLDQTCPALASSAAVRALRSRALAPLPADFFASSRDRVGDFPTNFDELSAGFSCCRCGHVGNALALSIMSTAWPRMRDGSVGEALPCALVIWIAQVQARLRRRYSIGDIIGSSDLNSPTRFHENPFLCQRSFACASPATISSSVRPGCRAISANKKAACASSGEMVPPLGLGA